MSPTRMTLMDMPQWMGSIPWGLKPTQRTVGIWGKLTVGEVGFPREEHADGLFCAEQSALKSMHTSHIIWTEQATFRDLCGYTNTYLHEITKRPWIWRRSRKVWKEGQEGRIILIYNLKKYLKVLLLKNVSHWAEQKFQSQIESF